MKYVRALADGTWLEVPIPIVRPTEPDPHAPPLPPPVRTLVRAREQGIWCVNNDGVPVDYGLVVSFREAPTRAGSSISRTAPSASLSRQARSSPSTRTPTRSTSSSKAWPSA